MSFTVVIPARFGSTRFPGKPLADIRGKVMLQHVYERAIESGAKQVIIATDDDRIKQKAQTFGARVCMTGKNHVSGTSRIAEVIQLLELASDEIIVNVQGDEPFIPPKNISQVAKNLIGNGHSVMATLSYPIDKLDDVLNPNVVKVVADKQSNALYFSRASIPYHRSWLSKQAAQSLQTLDDLTGIFFRHIGIYAYRADFVSDYEKLEPSPLESIESLEQLRVLWHGYKIHVEEAMEPPPHGVDTPEDLAKFNT